MTTPKNDDRHSVAAAAELITDPEKKANLEAENALHQFDLAMQQVDYYLDPERPFKLRPSTITNLQRAALQGLSALAGTFRPAGIEIGGSSHRPPDAFMVQELVEELCDYINDNWGEKQPIHLAAYIMWRLNWIHPFVDGNGRTSRITAYMVLCLALGIKIPGIPTIPDQISINKKPYYTALEAADRAAKSGRVDVAELEKLLEDLLANQLASVLKQATGKD